MCIPFIDSFLQRDCIHSTAVAATTTVHSTSDISHSQNALKNMSIIRPPTLSEDEMSRLLERLANSNVRLTMVDPRVSQTQNWILGTVGAGLVVVGGWAITSINNLNTTMARVVEQNNTAVKTNEAQDRRFDNQDRRMDGFDARLREAEKRP